MFNYVHQKFLLLLHYFSNPTYFPLSPTISNRYSVLSDFNVVISGVSYKPGMVAHGYNLSLLEYMSQKFKATLGNTLRPCLKNLKSHSYTRKNKICNLLGLYVVTWSSLKSTRLLAHINISPIFYCWGLFWGCAVLGFFKNFCPIYLSARFVPGSPCFWQCDSVVLFDDGKCDVFLISLRTVWLFGPFVFLD